MITLFTDGSCVNGNPGMAGAGWAVSREGKLLAAAGVPLGHGTNNVGELTAVIQGLLAAAEHAEEAEPITVVTDSRYVLGGMEHVDRYTVAGKPNCALWRTLGSILEQTGKDRVRAVWVRGHASSAGNKLCDRLANTAARTQEEFKWK